MRSFLICLTFSLCGLSFSAGPRGASRQQEVLVAAAADLKYAMDSIVTVLTRQEPSVHVKVVYGSSGNFFEQIVNGAPFDLFFSADMDYPARLHKQEKTLGDVTPYATGHLVLWSNKLDPAKEKMNSLTLSSVVKIAIANPAHAPYGKRAEETLRYYKLYDQLKEKLVIGENISQTAQYAKTGAADIGMIALSLALSPAMQEGGGKYWVIPESAHQPLRQGFVTLPHGKNNPGVKKLSDFISSSPAAAVFSHFGFDHP
jgi:molybdate transport system substrate-binding protein